MADEDVQTLTRVVEAGKIAEFARAIRDDNPIYFDEAAARAAGFTGIPVPPTFFEIWLRFLNFGEEHGDRPRGERPRGGGGGFDGGREIQYLGPIVAGDVLTMTQRDAGSSEREGRRGGKLTFSFNDSEFTNQRGERVLVVRQSQVGTSQVPGE